MREKGEDDGRLHSLILNHSYLCVPWFVPLTEVDVVCDSNDVRPLHRVDHSPDQGEMLPRVHDKGGDRVQGNGRV